ncbi:unnamed protein product [Camellia sinensis]
MTGSEAESQVDCLKQNDRFSRMKFRMMQSIIKHSRIEAQNDAVQNLRMMQSRMKQHGYALLKQH